MTRGTRLALLALAAIVAAVFATTGAAGGSGAASSADQGPPASAAEPEGQITRTRGRRISRVRGSKRFGRLSRRQQRLPRKLRRTLEQRFGRVNPPGDPSPPNSTPPQGPRHAASGDVLADPQLDSRRRGDSPRGVRPPSRDDPQPRRRGAVGPSAHAGAANDFELFRNQPVAQGSGVTGVVAEPTVANDRNALLFTGNWHAAVSPDNGITWQYLNPATQFSSLNAGFCCDQIAYDVDRGSYSLIFWLMQYSNDGTQGSLRLAVYQGRNELLDQANFCDHVITPERIGETGWFDFNVMANTDEHLFISSKIFDAATNTYKKSVVMRWDLSDLDDGNCDLTSGRVYKDTASGAQNIALTRGAGSTMYWGYHTGANTVKIGQLPDSSNTATFVTKTVSSYASSDRGDSHCPVPDSTDPCRRANNKMNVGFIHQGRVVFAWNVAEGSGFNFPHIRMARFSLPSLNLVDEPDVFNQDYAWIYPAAGINASGHLGLSLYRIGGGSNPRARVALVDDVDTNIFSLNMHGIITSTDGTSSVVSNAETLVAGDGRWGDYASVRAYGNCADSFSGAVHSQQGGINNANSEHRFIWFGRERDGCPDLVVDDTGVLPTTAERGDTLFIGETTRNIGSATAGASTTRFYLSRDESQSNDDLLLDGVASHSSLGAGASEGLLATATVPNGAIGSYYLLSCADDTKVVSEITDTNNCLSAGIVDVELSRGAFANGLVSQIRTPQFGTTPQGGAKNITVEFRRFDGNLARSSATRPPSPAARSSARRIYATLLLSRRARLDRRARVVGRRALPARRTTGRKRLRKLRRRVKLRVPRRLRPADYYVIACVDTRRRSRASRCVVGPHVLHVVKRRSRRR